MRSDPFPPVPPAWSPYRPTASQVPLSLQELGEEEEKKERGPLSEKARHATAAARGEGEVGAFGALLQSSQSLKTVHLTTRTRSPLPPARDPSLSG